MNNDEVREVFEAAVRFAAIKREQTSYEPYSLGHGLLLCGLINCIQVPLGKH